MDSTIQIIEKPDWLSWNEISALLWQAHGSNREKGMNMKHASFSGEEIKEHLEPDGKMFVALSENKMIGVAAYKPKRASFWFGEGLFAYCCFAAVLPQYTGKGIYGQLVKTREDSARLQGIDKMMFNTHPRNYRVIQIAQQFGYKKVDFRAGRENSWVFMVKWLNGMPYSESKINIMYAKKKLLFKIKSTIKRVLKKGGR